MRQEQKMAEEIDELLPEFDENEEDVLLQTQMKVYNFIMGYWKEGLGVIGILLLGILVQGLYVEHIQAEQRSVHSELEIVRSGLPEVNPMSRFGAATDNPNDMKRMEALRDSAAAMEKIAETSDGAAEWFSWMEAAKIWNRANETDAEIVAIQKAIEATEDPVFTSSATLQLANRYVDAEKAELAISLLEGFIASSPVMGVEQARLNLSQVYKENGNMAKSKEHVDALAGSEFLASPEIQALVAGIVEE